MSDDTTDAETDAETTENPRPVRDAFPFITAERGKITASGGICAPVSAYYDFRNPSAAPTAAPAKRLTLVERARKRTRNWIGARLVKAAHRFDGTECHDEDCW
jgi:hypothetical protein